MGNLCALAALSETPFRLPGFRGVYSLAPLLPLAAEPGRGGPWLRIWLQPMAVPADRCHLSAERDGRQSLSGVRESHWQDPLALLQLHSDISAQMLLRANRPCPTTPIGPARSAPSAGGRFSGAKSGRTSGRRCATARSAAAAAATRESHRCLPEMKKPVTPQPSTSPQKRQSVPNRSTRRCR